jgi:hypothetical protein
MSMKSATPSGSQRSRTPDAALWMKMPLTRWGAIREHLPAPWTADMVEQDLEWMEARLRFNGTPPDGAPVAASRWGVSRVTAWRRLKAIGIAEAVQPAETEVKRPATDDVLTVGVLEADCNRSETACNRGETEAATMPTDAAFQRPQEEEKEEEKPSSEESPSAPADAPAEPGPSRAEVRRASLEALWAEFQTMRKAADPSARNVGLDVHLKALERCLKALQPLAREHGCKPGEALLVGWWTFWHGADDFWRTKRAGVLAVQSYLRPDNCGRLAQVGLDAMAAVREAQTPPTADAVLDVLLAEGQDRAEARMPAWASTLRWTVARMGGDVGAMRTARSPERMRAAWATAWGEALARPRVATSAEAAPPLALVAR